MAYRCCEHCWTYIGNFPEIEKDQHDEPCAIRGCQEGKTETP